MTALETSSSQRLDWLTGSFGDARLAKMGRQVTVFPLHSSPESSQWVSDSRKRPVVTECSRPFVNSPPISASGDYEAYCLVIKLPR